MLDLEMKGVGDLDNKKFLGFVQSMYRESLCFMVIESNVVEALADNIQQQESIPVR